ncbi:hypothetical protein LCGC14_1885980 [marine sediment metagenome]|uniref:Uncharacterized protein n=1 Tax=marine sediment metagenome TaxID=412755 RepID=A0A0F9GP98_9ZZZZ
MITITYFLLALFPTLCLLLGMLLGVALSVHVGPWVARLYDRLFIPTPLSLLPMRVRAALRRHRHGVPPHSLPLHTHTSVWYRGVPCGYLRRRGYRRLTTLVPGVHVHE